MWNKTQCDECRKWKCTCNEAEADKIDAQNNGQEWWCPECHKAGKYYELTSSGVDCCPDCRSPVDDIEI